MQPYEDCAMFKCKTKIRDRNVLLIYRLGTMVIGSLAFAGCSTVETQSFNVNTVGNVESAYVAVGADFSKYDRLQTEDMGIFFPADSGTPPEDIQRIRQIFRSAFVDQLQGYVIVNSPGPSTMKVQASLIDLRNSSTATLMNLSREVRDIASNGELLFLMEFRDSSTDDVLARAADSAKTPTFATSENVVTDWSSVEAAAQHWAALFRNFLDQNLSH
jgi:hypothetical protein